MAAILKIKISTFASPCHRKTRKLLFYAITSRKRNKEYSEFNMSA